ncbi:MAG: co-chaperone GroES [Planctomycetota bacterium]|nr:MAG: co-chaperone GroES [Planctomycetota bacterium]
MSKIKPLEDRLVVKRLDSQEKTAGGIILPDSAQEKPQKGKIVAVGSGKVLDNGKRAKSDVSVGDVVIFSKYGGTEVTLDGEEHLILNESDVLALVK